MTTLFLSALGVVAAGTAHAQTSTINTASADTFVYKDNGKGYGSEQYMYIKNTHNGTGGKTRKGIMRFANDPMKATSAMLILNSIYHQGNITVHLWGINEGNCAEQFNESTASYGTFPYFDSSDDGVNNSSPCLFGGTEIATFVVNRDGYFFVSNQALVDFLNADTNDTVTFALTTDTSDKNGVEFASREHGADAPRLLTGHVSGANINTNFVGGTMSEDGGVTHFSSGTLKIPLSTNGSVSVPIADADMTLDSQGNVVSFNGTVGGSITFPTVGVLGALGPAINLGQVSIGYDSPSNGGVLGSLDLPLSERAMRAKYFYFYVDSGAGFTFGPLEVTPPIGGGQSVLVIGPDGPAVYTATNVILNADLSLGISGADSFAYTPLANDGVESYLTPFNGNLYASGTVNLPLKEDVITASLTGESVLDVDANAFASGVQNGDVAQLGQWMNKLAGNGSLSIAADLGNGLGLSFDDIVGSSVLYDSHVPSLAFAGYVDSGALSLPSLPLAFNGKLNVSGYVNAGNLLNSYYQVGGALKFPNGYLSGNSISATVKYGPTQVGFHGSIKFGGFNFGVSGDVTPARVKVSGSARASISYTLNYGLGKKKITAHFTIKGTFDSSKSTPDFDFSDLDSGFSNAVGSLTGDGHIKVCIDFPKVKISGVGSFGIGRVCQNL